MNRQQQQDLVKNLSHDIHEHINKAARGEAVNGFDSFYDEMKVDQKIRHWRELVAAHTEPLVDSLKVERQNQAKHEAIGRPCLAKLHANQQEGYVGEIVGFAPREPWEYRPMKGQLPIINYTLDALVLLHTFDRGGIYQLPMSQVEILMDDPNPLVYALQRQHDLSSAAEGLSEETERGWYLGFQAAMEALKEITNAVSP